MKDIYTLVRSSGINVEKPDVLLFHGKTQITPDKAREILHTVNDKLAKERSDSLYGTLSPTGVFRIQLENTNDIPENLKHHYLIKEDTVTEFDQIYNDCPLLTRLAEGCVKCSNCKYVPCNICFEIPVSRLTKSIGDYTYIAPKHLSTDEDFTGIDEHCVDIDRVSWEEVEDSLQRSKERAQQAASTRKYVKDHCSKCCLSKSCKATTGWNHPCKRTTHYATDNDIISKHYSQVYTMPEEQREILSKVAYLGGTNVKIGRSTKDIISGQTKDLSKYTEVLVPVIRNYYPFNKSCTTLEYAEKSSGIKNFPVMSDHALAMYLSITKITLNYQIRILGHTNYYLGVGWNGNSTLTIRTANSTNSTKMWNTKVNNFADIYRALNRI